MTIKFKINNATHSYYQIQQSITLKNKNWIKSLFTVKKVKKIKLITRKLFVVYFN